MGAAHDDDEFNLGISHSQCDNDIVSFMVVIDNAITGTDDMDLTVVDAVSNVPLITYDDAVFFRTTASKVFYISDVFSTGAYVAVVTTDQSGPVEPDFFDAEAFNVPIGSCIDTEGDDSPIFQAIQDFRLNSTSYLDHINQHLHNIDANVTFTREEILVAIQNLNVTIIGNVTGNFTLDNATLSSIYNFLIEKFGPEGEPMEIELGSLLFLLIVFVLMVIWAEIRKEVIPYIVAILVGSLLVMGGWGDITGTMRSAVVVILLYLGLRLIITVNESKQEV
jgi:hypothetical protein